MNKLIIVNKGNAGVGKSSSIKSLRRFILLLSMLSMMMETSLPQLRSMVPWSV